MIGARKEEQTEASSQRRERLSEWGEERPQRARLQGDSNRRAG